MSLVVKMGSISSASSSKEIKDKRLIGLVPIHAAQKVLSNSSVFSSFFNAVQKKRIQEVSLATNSIPAQTTYDVYEACENRDEGKLREALSKGANPNLHPGDSLPPLFVAVSQGNKEMVRILLEAKADPNLISPSEGSVFCTACLNNCSEEIFRLLMAQGANPFALKSKSFIQVLCNWEDQKEALRRLQICTGTEGIIAFDSCKDVHDFFSVLFPSFKEVLPPNSASLIAHFPKCEKLELLNQKAEDLKGKWPSLEDANLVFKMLKRWDPSPNPPSLDIEFICQVLQKFHPLFDLVWKEADNPQLLETQQMTSQGDHTPIGYYFSKDHKILINSKASNSEKLDALVFETLHALQRDDYLNISSRTLVREDYVFSMEYLELRSFAFRAKLFKHVENSFLSLWKHANNIGHAGAFRRGWDEMVSFCYWSKNQDIVQERINALRLAGVSEELLESKETIN